MTSDVEKAVPIQGRGSPNFRRMVSALTLTRLGDYLMSPKVVLAWLLGEYGVPQSMIAWLVPIRESGSMLPQIALGEWLKGHARRKGFWVAGSLVQGLCVVAMALSLAAFEGAAAGVAVLLSLSLFALARAVCSIAVKDVQGNSIARGARGQVSGHASMYSGLAIGAVAAFLLWWPEEPGTALYMSLLLGGALCWPLGSAFFARIAEPDNERSPRALLGDSLWRTPVRLLVEDRDFRHFVLARGSLLGASLAAPFVLLQAQTGGNSVKTLGSFLLANSLAASFSARFWGRWADRSSRRVMIWAGALSALCCFIAAASGTLLADFNLLTMAAVYLVLSVAYEGVRLGRKTYVVDMAEGNRRTDYVAISNTAIAILLLFFGGLGALFALVSTQGVLLVYGLLTIVGVVLSVGLREVQAG
ncbi:MAG: MFS transporter [Pseudomonadota bacterium]